MDINLLNGTEATKALNPQNISINPNEGLHIAHKKANLVDDAKDASISFDPNKNVKRSNTSSYLSKLNHNMLNLKNEQSKLIQQQNNLLHQKANISNEEVAKQNKEIAHSLTVGEIAHKKENKTPSPLQESLDGISKSLDINSKGQKEILKKGQDYIKNEALKTNDKFKKAEVNLGQKLSDFNKSDITSQQGYLVASQGNLGQEQSFKLLA